MKVLIVDDKEENRYMLDVLLRGNGYDVTGVANGAEALEILKSGEFGLIVSDILMPDMDGFQLCRKIKTDEALRHIPFIVYTATYTGPQDEAFAFKIGADRFIQKPCEPDVFMEAVRDVVAGTNRHETVSTQAPIHEEEMLKLYSERLVRKLEQKMLELEREVQARIETEESLRKSERKYRLLTDNTLDVIWAMDMDLTFTYVNPAIQSLMGYSPEEWIGSRLSEHCDEENFAKIAQVVADETAKGPHGSGVTIETVLLNKNRDPIPFEIHGKANFDEKGEPTGLQGVARDITERKKAEEHERSLMAILRSIRNVNRIIVHEKNQDSMIQHACENLTGSRGFQGAWIVLTGDSSIYVKHGYNGFDDGVFDGLAAKFRAGELPDCCRRIRAGGGVAVTHAPAVACKDCPLAGVYAGNAAMTVELRYQDKIYGWLSVSVPSNFVEDPEEISLLTEIAEDLAFALHGMDVEAERNRSEQTLRAIFESASDGILLADVESGRFVKANESICRMLGYSDEEIKRLSVADIHPVEDLYRVRSQFERQGRGEITLTADIPVKRRDGSIFPADVSAAPLELEGRRHLLGIFRDTTERKESEKATMEAYDIINRSSSVAFTWKNQEGWPVEFVSKNVEKIFGYAEKEFMTGEVNYADCVHSDDLDRVAKEVAAFSSKTETTEFIHEPYRIIAKDGSERIVDDRTCIVRANDGRITHYKGIVEDITGQKMVEKERESLEEQLRQSQKLESVGRLTGGIAHDFNNLLTTIIGNAEMAVMEMDKDAPLHEILKEIKAAGDRAAGLIRQLLAFSRKQILQPEVMDLNHVVKETDRMLRRVIGEDISLETCLGHDLSPVDADITQVEQILMNLAVNARDAMPMGGKLTIETQNVMLDEDYARVHIAVTSGSYVMLAVSDTGSGMTKDVQEHLFEPFFTTKAKDKGTGLGLSTVYGIVKQSKGNIWVYSEPGKGTTVKIYFPAAGKNVSEKGRTIKGEAKGLLGSETILVVEDDESVRKMATKTLEKYGYTVLQAGDGQEALQRCEENKNAIHLMVTDVVMPGMSGKELADRLKDLMPDMKVLFTSGYTDNAIVHHGVLERGIAFLQKPFMPGNLARKVRELLDA